MTMDTVLIDRTRIVETARLYVGTPFLHGGRMRGHGIDCAGLLTCVAYDLRMRDVRINGYSREPNEELFRALLAEHCDPIAFSDLAPADILTFAMPREQHLALVSQINPILIIHAYEKAGRCTEQPLANVWLNRLRGCWRFREAAPWIGEA